MLKINSPKELKILGLKNVYFDISATREYWAIERGIEEVGPERFIFGSDFPVMHPRMMIEAVEALDIAKEEKEKIYSGNILKLLDGQRRI
jgi:hypothetical protein